MSSLNVLAFIVSEICALKRIDSANDQEHILYIKINKKHNKILFYYYKIFIE